MSILMQDHEVWVGSYASSGRAGIHLLRLYGEMGTLCRISSARGIDSPTFLAIDPERRLLFAVSETEPEGAVASYRFDPDTGRVEEISRQPTYGAYPCHLQLHPSGRWLLVVNYQNGAAVCVYPVEAGGELGTVACCVHHAGKGVHADRQEAPHPHSIFRIPGTDHYLVSDLGTDRVSTYRLDTESGQLTLLAANTLFAGGGPRHLAYHPSLPIVYVIHELGAAITVHQLDAETGVLWLLQQVSTLPDGHAHTYPNGEVCAEIAVSETGEYVYGSNRQHDTIAVFQAGADGLLRLVGHVSSGGETPRGFCLVQGGEYLLAANQDSNLITVHRIGSNGMPSPTGHNFAIESPAFIKAIPIRR